ncbi:CPBP family intramembrane glutamic endopeptidase [Synechococcus sp. Cruz CV12-2-Slac-r]|uniref:CPBP family intramembrane glutamic endopeptidase n=1 Tax=Synechococcus sp. Cruz CV12-2-Slac-r TaxID=2823748 RepID=UPI0020CC9449|nr:CPBP family intramembrane glutamic endopeptidase [Synechococcus sp. Cruz CV12-2-Slac-r]MCP9939545.1 CPBP family intramembrane metalloprotease [Synechococcus sp. Cruz CV12-2-Slac-r]
MAWLNTLLYPAVLVAIFLGFQALGAAPAVAALPALLALLVSLPLRVKNLWKEKQAWISLGVVAPSRKDVFKVLLRGFIKAVLLLLVLLIGLFFAGQIKWQPQISAGLLLNGFALGVGVGFAEELLFRGWLLGELEFRFASKAWGKSLALVLQALVFSLAHTRFNLPLASLCGLLGGLTLLGLALGLQRRADAGLIWGAVALHGGLVGGWFVLNQGLIGQQEGNPIGSWLAWIPLLLLIWVRRRWW